MPGMDEGDGRSQNHGRALDGHGIMVVIDTE
jgi:hypothetical protein